ncbi:N-acetyl-gamma-glutamyl-phosphate reductase [Microbacter margulisiae]|uniref:N-acetyl-gamma-glutamyl-phosphate reductase n=1 Tax=Microbacter margulisiae TaxID=1350067 RepID=A0A7W5H1P9_9PORP|nr:N-acetyl-gamma-glutamyl-phosphate reductase [Microbacter margulisiae]MBB3186844.1 N-acetyl-gamma-glutamyl-phosphate reductase [Microbacter margulisiae]
MIKAGIIGGAGYTAGELIRILINHPEVEIIFVHSESNADNNIVDVHSGLLGETSLTFTNQLDKLDAIDVLFFCTAHGDTQRFLDSHSLPESLKIIDLSTDYRQKREGNPFVYGLPELNRNEICHAKYISNPGCFATAIQLAVLPLANHHSLHELHVHAITGSTGAGVKPSSTTHFSWRNDNISAYKIFNHQHLAEIRQSICQLQSAFEAPINFVPLRGDFARGIFATLYTECNLTIEEAYSLYSSYYTDAPFTIVTKHNPDLKQVVNTNKCVIYLEKHDTKLVIVSMIDNLLKGASGQAVENMNLIFGLKQTTGLQLKSIGF